MKKDIFLWCRYRVKNWLKTVCTLNCKSTRLWNDNEFMPSNLHAFLWRTSTHTLWRHCWQHKRIWILLKKKKKKKKIDRIYARMLVGWLCWGLTSQSTIFQLCWDGVIASWVINQYFRGVKCLAQGHNTAEVGLEPRTSRSGVRHSTTEPPRSPCKDVHWNAWCFVKLNVVFY